MKESIFEKQTNRPFLTGFLMTLFLSGSFLSRSQSIRSLSTQDGLPQSFISGLVQDDSSFIWIATRNGLARYDGIRFKLYQHSSRDTTTLASNLIIWLRRDRHNNLWIEYESGELDMMNPVTEKVSHYIRVNTAAGPTLSFIRRGWLVDEDGMFWGIMKGAGFIYYDVRGNRSEHFTRQSSGLASDTIRGLAEDDGKVWSLNDREIRFVEKKSLRGESWPIPYHQDFGAFTGSEAIAIDLHIRKNKELMWGDRKNIYFFDPRSHRFRMVSLPADSYLGVRWIRAGADGSEYFENYGQIYRYSEQSGVALIGENFKESVGDVKSFLVDRSGLIWLGTNAKGLRQIDLHTPFFRSRSYRKNFCHDVLDEKLGIHMESMFNWTAKDEEFSQPSYYLRSAYDARKRFYLALKETICYSDAGNKTFVKLPVIPILADSEKLRIAIRGISFLPDGSPIVIAYNGNLMSYDSAHKKWNSFIEPGLLRKKFGGEMLPLNLLADDHDIWISTEKNGLIRINIHTREMIQCREDSSVGSLPASQLLGLMADPSNPGLLWIGSYQGLIVLNKSTLRSRSFSLKEGLPDNTIYSMLFDSAGNLWLATNKGICRFDLRTQKVRAFHTVDGLAGDEFNRFHQLQLPDGTLSFGGTDGLTFFNPLGIRNDDFEPTVALTSLKINNQEITTGTGKTPLHVALNATQQIILPYEKNTVNLSFAGLEFSAPHNLEYRYRLEGYDNGWVSAGNSHEANYTKIPPGHYTLLINASNTSGIWSPHIKKIDIRIQPPWYGTRMAYVCYCIILAGLVWAFIRFRVSRELMKQNIVMKEKETLQLKELDDMKSRFFSNITHEFRTPLTLIMGPAEQLTASDLPDSSQKKLAGTILQNAKQLLVLINRLMDLSRLEAKALQLHEQRGSPAESVRSVLKSFEHDAKTKAVHLSFEDLTGQLQCWFYADALERIVFNLISNALKFTPAGGNVDVRLRVRGEQIELGVDDTGIGITQEKLPFIFDRFYQAGDDTGLAKEATHLGSGIGLSLVKELVSQMQGSISVDSETWKRDSVASGTRFTVQLPFRNTFPEQTPDTLANGHDMEINEAAADSSAHILLVEDNMELTEFIKNLLSPRYVISHVQNGALGLKAAVEEMPDLIISDVMMPVMDGYEMCGLLKEDIRSGHIPVIMLTAKVAQENKMEGLTKGADDYLTKPFHPGELLIRINNLLLRQKKLSDRIRAELASSTVTPAEKEILPLDIFLVRLYEQLDEHLDESLFGVDQLADAMHLSRSSLHRKLKALTDMSTTEVVRNYRLRKAAYFLLEGHSSTDAAYKSGFGSPAYFTKSFREEFGMTPGDYVKMKKG